ncbi:MAG: hypothetical protein R3B45_13040 [Bdellovibrionota bacterium]
MTLAGVVDAVFEAAARTCCIVYKVITRWIRAAGAITFSKYRLCKFDRSEALCEIPRCSVLRRKALASGVLEPSKLIATDSSLA